MPHGLVLVVVTDEKRCQLRVFVDSSHPLLANTSEFQFLIQFEMGQHFGEERRRQTVHFDLKLQVIDGMSTPHRKFTEIEQIPSTLVCMHIRNRLRMKLVDKTVKEAERQHEALK